MMQPEGKTQSARLSVTPGDLAFVDSLVRRLKAGTDLRHDKIHRIRSAICAHDYENPLKLDIAAERVVEEIETEKW